jgi:DNA-binding transcriptional regulator YiaG
MAKTRRMLKVRGEVGRGARLDWSGRLVAMRERLGLSQKEFAVLVGVSVKTLQNWEQRRRQPTGPAEVLLRVVEAAPDSVMRALR